MNTGRHIFIKVEVDKKSLNKLVKEPDEVMDLLSDIADSFSYRVVGSHRDVFDDGKNIGVTGYLTLAESCLVIHTYAEYGIITIDFMVHDTLTPRHMFEMNVAECVLFKCDKAKTLQYVEFDR